MLEEKAHSIKLAEIQIKKMKEKLMVDYSGLPPDLKTAENRLFDIQNLVLSLE